MKCLVVGYGSIGARHTRLLVDLGCEVAVVSERDIDFKRRYRSLTQAVQQFQPEYLVIANKTQEHLSSLLELKTLNYQGRVLVEKPIFNKTESIDCSDFKKIAVAYNLRFHPVIVRLKDLIDEVDVLESMQVYAGQYLPDWRPDSDYRKCYSASLGQGGGVLRDLSHELDYINWLLGPLDRVASIGGHFSNLEISSDDVWAIIAEYKKCRALTLQLNYLDRTPRREIIFHANGQTVKGDLVANTLEINGKRECVAVSADVTYIEQHKAMMSDDCNSSLACVRSALEVVSTVEAIEEASINKTWVYI